MSGAHGEAGSATPVVDVHGIEQQLAELRWKLRPDGDTEAAVHAAAEARASVLNLITVVSTEAQRHHVSRVLDDLSVHHPSRTLILLAQEERGAVKLEASVTAQARPHHGRQITVEQVLLHAHGRVAEHLASLVMPLLIPDLPVMLWWPGRPDFASRLFTELAELADRLVVDTDDGFDPEDFPRLLDVARRTRARCAIGDFNWARLMPWRHLAAQFFDLPAMRTRLATMQGVDVLAGEGSTTQALLLAGWIQSRMASVGMDVPRQLRQDPTLDHGVWRLAIYTSGPDEPARFTITRERGGRLLTETRIGHHDLGRRTVRILTRSPEDLLGMELTLPGHDLLYEEALAAAALD